MVGVISKAAQIKEALKSGTRAAAYTHSSEACGDGTIIQRVCDAPYCGTFLSSSPMNTFLSPVSARTSVPGYSGGVKRQRHVACRERTHPPGQHLMVDSL